MDLLLEISRVASQTVFDLLMADLLDRATVALKYAAACGALIAVPWVRRIG